MAVKNEYTVIDSNNDTERIIASSMDDALIYWNANNNIEPLQVYKSKQGLVVAQDVTDPEVTVVNSETAKGTLYPSADFSVNEGSEVIFTAVPASGYAFSKLTKVTAGVTTEITDNPAKIKITGDTVITVTWETA
jgi:hypothetical protein